MKQVNFKKLEIENFLSVGNEAVVIDFKTGLNIITGINHDKDGSRNGVGKTTIADALYFCLFGTTIRDLKKEEIVNNTNQKRCRTKIEFDVVIGDNIDSYVMERKISPTKLTLTKNGEDITESSMVKTTERVGKIIGASPEVFKNAVIMTVNGTTPFMAQSRVERRKFCEGLFNLGVFQDMLLESRKLYNAVKNEISIERAKKDEVNNTLDIYKKQRDKKHKYRKTRTEVLKKRESDNVKELKDLENKKLDIDNDDIDKFKENIKLLESKLSSTQKHIRKGIRDIATKEEQISSKKKTIKELNEFGDMCEQCKRPFTENDKRNREDKINSINKDIKDLKSEIIDISKAQNEFEAVKEKCERAIKKQQDSISEIKHKLENKQNIENRIAQLKTWNEQITVDIQELDQECNDVDNLVSDAKLRLKTLNDTITNLNKRLMVLDGVKYIVSEEGVKSYIIKKVLSILNGKLSYYLQKMDAPCKFKFNEYFDEQIINEKKQECSYNNFSSGEKKRIDLAILFTFMDIRRLQGNNAINISFYDEILDTSIDDKGVQMFLDILNNRVESYGESCYIISHKNTAIKAATRDIIFLEKKGGFTTVSEYTEDDYLIDKI